ncbi:MAG: sigma-70 family RNA polymerase sigma factor [Acidobacteria bacterium]|nr:MAG: sigma-70 family RNA polymerase sigma factor [Acidobacteriota bacterium]PYY04666.1 MAG: sigma-70 family RNA polymerase sigma factor [Acidobacteriota bacterium]
MASVGDSVDVFAASLGREAVTNLSARDATGDSSLVSAAQAGDRLAFGQLYEQYARMVHGILMARVPPGQVDDLVQDVFLVALRRLSALRDISRFGAWLAAIARNRANDYHRQSMSAVEVTDDFSQAEAVSGVSDSAADSEAAVILAAIRSLPEAYREPLILRLVEGMTGPEIAARTGLKPGSVRVNLHRGIEQLREKLAQRL